MWFHLSFYIILVVAHYSHKVPVVSLVLKLKIHLYAYLYFMMNI